MLNIIIDRIQNDISDRWSVYKERQDEAGLTGEPQLERLKRPPKPQ